MHAHLDGAADGVVVDVIHAESADADTQKQRHVLERMQHAACSGSSACCRCSSSCTCGKEQWQHYMQQWKQQVQWQQSWQHLSACSTSPDEQGAAHVRTCTHAGCTQHGRHRHRQTDKQTNRQTDGQTDRQRNTMQHIISCSVSECPNR